MSSTMGDETFDVQISVHSASGVKTVPRTILLIAASLVLVGALTGCIILSSSQDKPADYSAQVTTNLAWAPVTQMAEAMNYDNFKNFQPWAETDTQYNLESDIDYGGTEGYLMELYSPTTSAKTGVLFTGGEGATNQKYGPTCALLVSKGYACAFIRRKVPEDVQIAYKYLLKKEGFPTSIFIWGFSQGGEKVTNALLSEPSVFLEDDRLKGIYLQASAAPLPLPAKSSNEASIQKRNDNLKNLNWPPFLLSNGDKDTSVSYWTTLKSYKYLKEIGRNVEFLSQSDVGHVAITNTATESQFSAWWSSVLAFLEDPTSATQGNPMVKI